MAISKLAGASPKEISPGATGPSSSLRRLEQALHSGNVREAKLALDVAIQGLPTGAGRGKELTNAVAALTEALKTGDMGKANDAFASVKEQSQRAALEPQKVTHTNSTNGSAKTGSALQQNDAAKTGMLDVKA